jgi:hypothetical protein
MQHVLRDAESINSISFTRAQPSQVNLSPPVAGDIGRALTDHKQCKRGATREIAEAEILIQIVLISKAGLERLEPVFIVTIPAPSLARSSVTELLKALTPKI